MVLAPEPDEAPEAPDGVPAPAEPAESAAPIENAPAETAAPAEAAAPSRSALERAWAVLRHEWTLAALGSVLIAILLTWPTLADPAHTLPADLGDPALQAWQVAWAGHILLTDPVNLWHGNGFYPESFSYAYSDTLLGYAPFGFFGSGPEATLIRYNILFVLAHALAAFGAYVLARQLGSGRTGAAVAGLVFGFAPWRITQAGHLHVLSTGGIALALAMLARGHGYSLRDGYRPERVKRGWAIAGWLVAAWQITLGFGIGVPFGYVIGLTGLAAVIAYGLSWWLRGKRPAFRRDLLLVDVGGVLVFLGTVAFMAWPYLQVVKLNPGARRSIAELQMFSPPLRGLFTAPGENWMWGQRHEAARALLTWTPEMTLLPGFTVIVLAALGIFISRWKLHQRLLLGAGVLVTGALAMGTNFATMGEPGYVTLYNTLPGFDAIRTPGRLIVWTTLLLALLAAGTVTAVSRFAARLRDERVARLVRAVLAVILVVVLAESLNTLGHPQAWREPTAMRGLEGPAMILPSDGILEADVLLWSTDGFPRIVNGLSGMTPHSQEEARAISQSFPDPNSVAYLRNIGVRTVIYLPEFGREGPWAQVGDRSVDGLGVDREEVDGAIVFHIR
jgi:hypothetical protein